MKITKQDIKTLEKIRKMCEEDGCDECAFCNKLNQDCILQSPPCSWELEKI